jgi:peptidoglycan/xylan/chitin deacetylase (PgdA/CDA1 family)
MRLFHKAFYYSVSFFGSLVRHNVLIYLTKQHCILPLYHAVSDSKPVHLKHLYPVINIKKFKNDLDFILKYYNPVNVFELIDFVKAGNIPGKNVFFLSFDDGLSEFYHIVAPLLLAKGVPATCFLNSAFIDNKDLFFRYKASILIEAIKKTNVKSHVWKTLKGWFADNTLSITDYKRELLKIKYNNKTKLDELADIMNFSFKDYLQEIRPYLTSAQIRELIKKGFTFGAHSIDHPEYRYIPFDEQIRQTWESINQITGKFNLNYRVFSFPFTDHEVSVQFFKEINKDNSIGFTAGSSGIKKDSIKNNIHRIPMDEYNLKGRTRIKIDYIYYLIKSVIDKNKITRK